MSVLTEVAEWIAGITAVVAGTPRTAASVNAGLTDLASRTKWVNERIYKLLFGAQLTVSSVDTATDRLTVTSHGLGANTPAQVFAVESGALPGGLAISTVYYVDVIDANTIKLSATSGPGAAVDLTAGFVGPVYVQAIPNWQNHMLLNASTYGIGKLTDLVMFLAGTQTVSGAKTFDDLTASGVTKYKLASRSKERVGKSPWWDDADNTMRMPSTFSAVVGSIYQAAIDLPNGSTLTSITVTVDPALHVSLPANMPTLIAYKVPISTGVSASLFALVTDSSANAGAYSAVHTITKTGLSEVIDNATYAYFVQYEHESGANSAAGVVCGVKYAVTVTSMDDCAS